MNIEYFLYHLTPTEGIMYWCTTQTHIFRNTGAMAASVFAAIHWHKGAGKSLARPDWKNNWKVTIFHPTRRSLLPRRPGWTDNFLNHFWVACKSYSLVAVACFLPGRAKDLSAPRYYDPISSSMPRCRQTACSHECHMTAIGLTFKIQVIFVHVLVEVIISLQLAAEGLHLLSRCLLR